VVITGKKLQKQALFRVLTACALCFAAPCHAQDNGTAARIESLLTQTRFDQAGARFEISPLLREIYRNLEFQPLWDDRRNIEALYELIHDADEHGLFPADYYSEVVAATYRGVSSRDPAATDLLLTEALLLYASHRRYGKVRARDLDANINYRRDPISAERPDQVIQLALSGSFLKSFMEMAAPSGPLYRSLQAVLEQYRDIDEMGGWPRIEPGPTLRIGDNDPRVALIRSYLEATGDLEAGPAAEANLFDGSLQTAVQRFQGRHALEADGIAGRHTLEAMAAPVTRRIDQLRLSLERLRWVNQEAVDTFVAVNIAGYRLFFVHDGEVTWETRTMVGKHYRQTPVFRDDIAYMEFNPTWTIPPGILRHDTLPAIRSDPGYLATKHIRVLDSNGREVDQAGIDWQQFRGTIPYTLRQDPGPWNSLGTVKFIFPNEHFVFLHDTPQTELFDRPQRAFSSGCVRVEDPLGLAELLLAGQGGQSRQELQELIDSRLTQRIYLEPKIPVIIAYLTASVDDEGRPLFYPDIYHRDAVLLAALNGAPRLQTASD
jgi:murein L,D-transpeptidase YcbB/YkuD